MPLVKLKDKRSGTTYGLHRMFIHTKEHYSFMTTMICICIHPLSLSFLKTNPFLLIRYCVSETAPAFSLYHAILSQESAYGTSTPLAPHS